MKKYIHITKEDREFLMKAFKCSEKTVLNAIRFNSRRGETELAHKIRKAALERGGIIMAVIPLMETLHDHDGYMRQYFPNEALLELNKADGSGVVFKNGKVVKRFEGMTMNTIEQAQAFAANL